MGDSTMSHEVITRFMEVDARLDALEATAPAKDTAPEEDTVEEDTYTEDEEEI